MLEARAHAQSVFVTLTYNDEELPQSGSLVPRDLTLFIKRLRKEMAPQKLRYYAVGEYGDKNRRPHYHAALFGYPKCAWGNSRYSRVFSNCCPACDRIRDVWGLGHIFLGGLEFSSAGYIAAYVTKNGSSERRLDPFYEGKVPEFSRMSTNPGIGSAYVDELASLHLQYGIFEKTGDVIGALRHGKSLYPLGRYLMRKVRERIGENPDAPPMARARQEASMLSVREATDAIPAVARRMAIKEVIRLETEPYYLSLKVRQTLKGKRK